MEIYGSIKLKGELADGTGDPLLTKDASTNSVGTAANALGTLTSAHLFVGNGSDVPTDVAVSGDVTISNAGVTSITAGCIVNADLSASAAIAFSKMAALTASRALASDSNGVVSVATTTLAELNFVSGASSNLQTQISGKQATITGAATTVVSSNLGTNRVVISNGSGKLDVSAITTTELTALSSIDSNIQDQLDTKLAPTITSVAQGDILYYNGTAWVNLARGTDGQTLRSNATSIQWDTPTINGIPIGGTDGQVLAKQSGTDFDADWETLTVSSITDLTATAAELNVLDGITATVTELNYTDGVSGPIQTQLDQKQSSSLAQNAIWVGNSSNVAAALSGGTNGYVLTSVSGVPTWQPVSAGSVPGSDTQVLFNDGGSFGADAGMVYDKTNNALTVGTYGRIHTYTGNAVASGALFIGNNSGNFTNTGQYIVGIGADTLTALTTGGSITAVGHNAGNDLTTGSSNTLIGRSAGALLTTGASNTVVGRDSMSLCDVAASSNTAVGDLALFTVDGDQNVAIGARAGEDITSGDGNTLLGYFSGNGLTTGSQNVIIGSSINAQSNVANGQLSIQNIIFGTGNTATGTTVSTGNIGIGGPPTTDKLEVWHNGSQFLGMTTDGRLYGTALHNNAGAVTGTTNQYIASGTYTPTLGNGANVSATTASLAQYIRVGNVVTVSGLVGVTPSVTATATQVTITLPIASDITVNRQCAGVGASSTTPFMHASVSGNVSGDTANLTFTSSGTLEHFFYFTFTYLIQ